MSKQVALAAVVLSCSWTHAASLSDQSATAECYELDGLSLVAPARVSMRGGGVMRLSGVSTIDGRAEHFDFDLTSVKISTLRNRPLLTISCGGPRCIKVSGPGSGKQPTHVVTLRCRGERDAFDALARSIREEQEAAR